MTRGTGFAVSPDKTNILARYVLDGQQWMCRGASWDFGVTGRAIGSHVNNIVFNAWAINALGDLVPARAAEAAAFSRRATSQDPPSANVPTGNRAFWCADYMSHLRPDYFASAKMFSIRTVGTETGSGEGQKNYYLPTGAFCLMKSGQEFHNIWPVWNWRGIPGITCAQSDDPYPQNLYGAGARGTTSFVGSVSDGTYGAAAFDFNRDNLKARKSWFFFDHEIVCLGAGITDTTGKDVHTTIDQSWLNNGGNGVSADQGGQAQTVSTGSTVDLSNSHWLLHGDVGYFFPQPQKVSARGEKRTGSWHDIEASDPPSKMQSGWVLEAWIDHGVSPQDAAYAYVVLPTTTASALATYQAPQILSNTPAQQAVWHGTLGILQAAFYAPGQVTLPTGETLAVDQPCLVMARKDGASWQVSVSDPTQLLKALNVTLGHAQIPITLPVFPENGKPVTATQAASGI
jgi:chondroitin AC lyase